jgi:hypothetical protein
MIEMHTTTGTGLTYVIREGGHVVMTSTDRWFRYLRALADLFLAGEIDADYLGAQVAPLGPSDVLTCPAARHILRSIYLAIDEPDCLHQGGTIACTCEPMDRRARLREMVGTP